MADELNISPEILIDLINFVLAFDAYVDHLKSTGADPDEFAREGAALLRRFMPELQAGLSVHLTELVERPDASILRTPLARAKRNGTPLQIVEQVAGFFQVMLPWLKQRAPLFRSLFSGRAQAVAMQVLKACDEDLPALRLAAASQAPSASRMTVLRPWIHEAAARVGMPVAPATAARLDAVDAHAIGTELKEVGALLQGVKPGSAESVELAERKAELEANLADLADNGNAALVQTVAAIAQAPNSDGYATEVGRMLGMTPEQEQGLLATGKAIVAAGAGSGKCVNIASTWVKTDLGFVTLKDLGVEGLAPEADCEKVLTVHGFDGPEKTSHLYNDGLRKTRKITTRLGYMLEATGPHQIKVWDEDEGVKWAYVQDLGVGDWAVLDVRRVHVPFSDSKGFVKQVFAHSETVAFSSIEEAVRVQTLLLSAQMLSKREGCRVTILPGLVEDEQQAWYFDPIDSIEESEALVGDLSVPGSESFSANGFINHNTRVLAGKVVDTIQRVGAKSSEIIATSFSRKSAAELKERIVKYGGEKILADGDQGIGTTHSLALKLLREFDPGRMTQVSLLNSDLSLIKLAMAQVKMRPMGSRVPVRPAKGMFEGLYNSKAPVQSVAPKPTAVDPQSGQVAPPPPGGGSDPVLKESFYKALNIIKSLSIWALKEFGPGTSWAKSNVQLIDSIQNRKLGFSELSDREQQAVHAMFARKGSVDALARNGMRSYRVASQDTSKPGEKKGVTKVTSPYWKEPANEWFNLGLSEFLDEYKQAIGVKRFATAISKFRGDMVTPEEARDQYGAQDPFAAVYGAYVWLLKNDPTFVGKMPIDDVIVEACKMLVADPLARSALQARYKHILVDEGQDQNRAQILMFGLIAGHTDAQTLKPYPDGRMSAKSFIFVGDDKQCVLSTEMVETPEGQKAVKELVPGDKVLAYRNGQIVPQTVKHNVVSSWTHGLKVTTASGKVLTMSLNHKLWATFADGRTLEGTRRVRIVAHRDHGNGVVSDDTNESNRTVQSYDSYREAIEAAHAVDSDPSECIWFEDAAWKMKAEDLEVGFKVPVYRDGALVLDPIVSIETGVPGEFRDLDVDDASNFIAGGILTSNSIYAFRGADPEVFVDRSDLRGGDFKTYLLDTNFRSGKAIVDAANNLIQHNKRQIPMTCKANVDRKGEGRIENVLVKDHKSGAAWAADQIQLAAQGDAASMSYKDFGVAVRTNAEAMAFGVEMLKRGIPFRTKMNFFGDTTTKALIGWLQLNQAKTDDEINELVSTLFQVPRFNLDLKFVQRLETLSRVQRKNYLKTLEWNWDSIYEDAWRNERYVRPYLEALLTVRSLEGRPTEIFSHILAMKGAVLGDKAMSLVDSLVEDLRGDPDALDLLLEESTTGKINDEDLEAAALAPLEPLMSLLEGYEELGAALRYIKKLQVANEKISYDDDPNDAGYNQSAVVIDTCHGWKGLEVKHIFVPMAEGVFPHRKSVQSTDPRELEAERRLAYVAITRGENRVSIISPKISHMGKPAGVSQFVTEACVRDRVYVGIPDPRELAESSSDKQASLDDSFLDSFFEIEEPEDIDVSGFDYELEKLHEMAGY